MPVTGVATTNGAGAGTLAARGLGMDTAGLMSAGAGTDATAVGGSVTPGVGVAPLRWIGVARTTGADILLRGLGESCCQRGYAHAYYVHQVIRTATARNALCLNFIAEYKAAGHYCYTLFALSYCLLPCCCWAPKIRACLLNVKLLSIYCLLHSLLSCQWAC